MLGRAPPSIKLSLPGDYAMILPDSANMLFFYLFIFKYFSIEKDLPSKG